MRVLRFIYVIVLKRQTDACANFTCVAAPSQQVALLRKSLSSEHLLIQEIFEGEARLVLHVHCFILGLAMKRHSHARAFALQLRRRISLGFGRLNCGYARGLFLPFLPLTRWLGLVGVRGPFPFLLNGKTLRRSLIIVLL